MKNPIIVVNEWSRLNSYFLLIAIFLFSSNQLLEFLAIKFSGHEYWNLCTLDCIWYSGIMENGYDTVPHAHLKGDAANWCLFPVLPLMGKYIHYVTNYSSWVSLLVVSKFFFLLSIFAFIKFGIQYNPKLNPILLGSIVTLNPYSIYGNVGYTEPLFLFFTCIFFYLLKRGNYLGAAIFGGILSAVKIVGVGVLFSYLSKTMSKLFSKAYAQEKKEKICFGLLIIPCGISLFMIFLYYWMGDSLAFFHIQRAWPRTAPDITLSSIILGLKGDLLSKYWAVMSIFALLIPVYFWVKKDFELALFSAFCTFIPLTTGLLSIPRFIWWQAPILLCIAIMLSRKWVWFASIPISVAGLFYMYFSWFSGKGFVL